MLGEETLFPAIGLRQLRGSYERETLREITLLL